MLIAAVSPDKRHHHPTQHPDYRTQLYTTTFMCRHQAAITTTFMCILSHHAWARYYITEACSHRMIHHLNWHTSHIVDHTIAGGAE